MPKYEWTATVTKPGHNPGRGSGTVEARDPEHAKALIKEFVARPGDAAYAQDIKLTPKR